MSIAKEYGGLAVMAGAAVAVLYYLGKRSIQQGAAALEDARQAVASSVGEKIHDWFYPQYRTPMFTYPVYLSGSNNPAYSGYVAAVNSEEIDPKGYFTYWRDGSKWRVAGTDSGKLIAIPADKANWEIQP